MDGLKAYTRKQIDPEALEIIESTGLPVVDGYRDPEHRDFSPAWNGLSQAWWEALRADQPQKYHRLIAICEEDFPTFCAVLLKVYNKTVARMHPFIYNLAQQYVWNIFAQRLRDGEPWFFVFLKARQFGVSTFVLGMHFWHTFRERDVACSVIAHDVPLTETLVRSLSFFYDELPDLVEIKPTLRQANRSAKIPKNEVYFRSRGGMEWRSRISTQCAKKIDARGATAKHILFSERAFYQDAQALEDAITPQLPPRGSPARLECSVISESTPNGQNHFYDLWQLSKQYDSETKDIFLPWFIAEDLYSLEPPPDWKMSREERSLMIQLSKDRKANYDGRPVTPAQMYWRRTEIDNKSGSQQDAEVAFDMEYPSDDETCFLMFRNKSVFKDDMKYLGACVSEMEELGRGACHANGWPRGNYGQGILEFEPLHGPFTSFQFRHEARPKFVSKGGGYLKVWEPPTPGHLYTVGSDAGDTQDNAVSQVICVTCAQQAAELVMHGEGPERFTDASVALCRWYFNALWMPEVNHVGTIVLKRGMKDWNYGNVCREEKWDEVALKKNKYGWMTSELNKPVLISGFEMVIHEHYLRIASRELRSEMSTFGRIGMNEGGGGRYKGVGNAHDDRVMAMALAVMAVRQSPKHFSEMTKRKHVVLPSAYDLGINDTVQIESRRNAAIPEAIKQHFSHEPTYDLSVNPIRGVFGGVIF